MDKFCDKCKSIRTFDYDLQGKSYVPGCWICNECLFKLTPTNLEE